MYVNILITFLFLLFSSSINSTTIQPNSSQQIVFVESIVQDTIKSIDENRISVNNTVYIKESFAIAPDLYPVKNKKSKEISSQFGYRMHPIYRTIKLHTGVDLECSPKDTIMAAGSGLIAVVEYKSHGYGNNIIIQHDDQIETRYCHLSKILVSPGQTVKKGQPIGIAGQTGTAPAVHLHFELIKNRKQIKPYFKN